MGKDPHRPWIPASAGMTEKKAGMTRELRERHQRNTPSHNTPSFPSFQIIHILVQRRAPPSYLRFLPTRD